MNSINKVLFTESAKTDLLDAWSFVAEQSVEAADHLLDLIDQDSQTLALQPLMGRARPDLNRDIRCWPTSASYNLYYTVQGAEITVIRVLHHARDITSRLF